MFLVDTADAAADWEGTVGLITGIIEKRGGEVVSSKKWDERRLAYEINKLNRGTFILVYFNANPLRIAAIERDVTLSENIIRVMILRADFMTEDDLNKETPLERDARIAEEEEAAAKEEQLAREAAAKEAAADRAASDAAEEQAADAEEAAEPASDSTENETEEKEPQGSDS